MRKKEYVILSILFVFLTIFLMTIDYCGVLGLCYIEVEKFNMDFWSLFINSTIVICLYVITYVLIDKNRIKQEDNKKNVAKLLLQKTYGECLVDIKTMGSKEYRTSLASKINFDKSIGDNPVYNRLME